MSNNYDFNITQGTSFSILLNATDSNGNPINLSGYNARGFVKNQYGDGSYIYNLNPTPILPFESGIVAISGNYLGTSMLPAGDFIYDVEILNGISCIQILNGDFLIYPSTAIAEPSGGFITAQTGAGASITINNYYINSGVSGISYLSIVSSANIVLTGYSNYIFTGTSAATWTLPVISSSINSNYFIKNGGAATVTLTGTYPDQLYSNQAISSFNIGSGEAYILSNDGQFWEIQ